jgi:(1->4)-alpha-D-glucan 1-alpha-D-glucosylmutase
MSAHTKIPRATYRLQFNEHFRLPDALALVPYLHELGVSHIYSSPLFKAMRHSLHGYDVCDFSQLNPEIGTESDLEKLVGALHAKKMGIMLDIVPNHMGIASPENLWWWDVLKNGRASRFADHFDISWESSDEKLHGKILVPILTDDYESTLQKGELKVEKDNDELVLRHLENRFPLAPNSIPQNSIEQLNSNHAALDELIQKQNYLLAFWRDGDLKLNYRRFFAVSTLAAIRVEDEKVFNDVHALLRKWIEKGWLDGLRVDHPDGLRDPENYLRRLRTLAPDLWIVVEKILQPKEQLPNSWPVQGTTGYDFLNQVNGLFIDSANEKNLTDFYSKFTGEPTDTSQLVQEKKKLVLKTLFATEVNRLTELLVEIAAHHPACEKFSRGQLREALIEFAASSPVYRTYVRANENFVGENDFHSVKQAATKMKELRDDLPTEIVDFLSSLMLLLFGGNLENEFVARFQQLTSPAMAKGVEDTAFYCLNHLASINEVGSDPGKFGTSVVEFHKFCGELQTRWPHTMLASSTHDTKRSEDVRARMNLLSEIPSEWRETVLRWSQMNERHRRNNFPDRNMEYLFYQTLVGTWPISLERIFAYMKKASCESKQHTDWNNRNAKYDEALKYFVTRAFADKKFIRDLESFISRLADAAQINSLAQTFIKLTAPGVPDIYQGNELLDFSLVDPDNRRPVDFELRKKMLAEIENLSAEEVWKRRADGSAKLWLTQKVLRLRAQNENLFKGNHEPLFTHSKKAKHIFAFIRSAQIISVVQRFILELKSNWLDTKLKLPTGIWRDEFSGATFSGEIAVADLFRKFPFALLVKGK